VKEWIGSPSDTEKHLSSLGKDLEFSDITSKGDTWFFALSVGIVLGVTRMVLENVDSLSLNVGATLILNERAFLAFEVVGASLAGVLLVFGRTYITPHALLTFLAWTVIPFQGMLIRPDEWNTLEHAFVGNALIEGAILVAAACFVLENHGSENFGLSLGL